MENKKYLDLGKNFYEWYRAKKVLLTTNGADHVLEREIQRVGELIEYVKEKKVRLVDFHTES